MDRLLIDECLSQRLVAIAKARGHDATHIVHLGKSGIQDWNIVPLVTANDFVFVTNNARDFLKLFARLDVHNGLIIILPNEGLDQQVRLFNIALDAAERLESTVNTVIEVREPGIADIREWPALEPP